MHKGCFFLDPLPRSKWNVAPRRLDFTRMPDEECLPCRYTSCTVNCFSSEIIATLPQYFFCKSVFQKSGTFVCNFRKCFQSSFQKRLFSNRLTGRCSESSNGLPHFASISSIPIDFQGSIEVSQVYCTQKAICHFGSAPPQQDQSPSKSLTQSDTVCVHSQCTQSSHCKQCGDRMWCGVGAYVRATMGRREFGGGGRGVFWEVLRLLPSSDCLILSCRTKIGVIMNFRFFKPSFLLNL